MGVQGKSIVRKVALRAIPRYARLQAAYQDAQAQLAKLSADNLALLAQLRQFGAIDVDDLSHAAFQYGIDQHWCDSSGIYLQEWVRHPDGPVSVLSVIAGEHRCRIESFLPHPEPGTAAFMVYVPWRAPDVLHFEVTSGQWPHVVPSICPPGQYYPHLGHTRGLPHHKREFSARGSLERPFRRWSKKSTPESLSSARSARAM